VLNREKLKDKVRGLPELLMNDKGLRVGNLMALPMGRRTASGRETKVEGAKEDGLYAGLPATTDAPGGRLEGGC